MGQVITVNFHDPLDPVWENIAVDVAIAPPPGNITINGAGTLDLYPMTNFLGVTVTTSTGLALLVSIPRETAETMLAWALQTLRERQP